MAEFINSVSKDGLVRLLRQSKKLSSPQQRKEFLSIFKTVLANEDPELLKELTQNHHIGLPESKAAQKPDPPEQTESEESQQEKTGHKKSAKGKLFDEPADAEPIPSRKAATDEDFEKFWKPYPRKVNKAKAREAFNRAFKKLRARMDADDVVKTIVDGAKVYATKANPEALCHPTTWLNGERWDDDPNGIATPSLSQSRNTITGVQSERKPQIGKFDPELRPKLTLEEKIRRARGK